MKKIYLAIISFGLLMAVALQAETSSGNSSVSAKKQTDGLYTITIKDSQGIKSFALKSPGNFPYSAELKGCPRVFVVNNVSPAAVNNFSGEVEADIVDCQNNTDELEIPEIGDKTAVTGKHEEPPAPVVKPAAPATPAAPSKVEVAPPITEAPVAKEAEIIYPVTELGGCANKDECKVYCEEPGNMPSCLNFAERHDLISKKEAEDGRKFSGIVNSRGGGPGGCKTRESCEAYCENIDNIEACLAFAEDSNLVEAKDLDEMRKVAKLLKEGEKFPGGCKSKSQCEAYCAEPNNMEVCLIFAEKAGFIPPEELEMAKKVVPLMKAGKTPGGCRSKEACETYCEDPDHIDVCMAFAEQMGAISPEEAAIIKKTGGKGPGGCRGRQQCEDFCQSPENQEVCFNFAKDNDLISENDLKQMEEGMSFIRDALSDESTELAQCLSEALGPDNVARVKGGQPIFDRGLEGKMRGCFEQFPPGGGGPGDGGFQGGPGGCKSQEECQAYCEANPDACKDFQPPSGAGGFPGGSGGFSGPGGCKSVEECTAYCTENPEDCKDFQPPGGGGQGGFPGGTSGDSDFASCFISELGEKEFQEYMKGVRNAEFNEIAEFCKNPPPPEPDYAGILAKCVSDRLGESITERWVAGIRSEQILRVYKYCFKQTGNPDWNDPDYAHITPGCNNRSECEAYCKKTPQNCEEFDGSTSPYCGKGLIWNGAECLSYPSSGFSIPPPPPSSPPPSYGGPGGCKSAAECTTYCTAHYTDPACASYIGGGGGGTGGGGGAACPEMMSRTSCDAGEERYVIYQSKDCGTYFGCRPVSGGGGGSPACDYAKPPEGCTLIPGPSYNSQTGCGLVLSCPAKSTQSCASPLSGLVSWWNGDTFLGAAKGGVAIAPDGKVGNAFKFNGSGSINMGNPANLNFGTGPFSLEAWFNWNGGGGTSANNIIRKSNYGPGAGSGYWLRVGAGKLEFSVGATTQAEGQTIITAPISVGVWHHAVGVKDASGSVKLYVDGESRGTILRQAPSTESTSGASFMIGAWDGFGISEFFYGLIDEVAVYNRALSASEVQAIFNAGSAGKCQQSSTIPQKSLFGLLRELIFGK